MAIRLDGGVKKCRTLTAGDHRPVVSSGQVKMGVLVKY